jgi:hypothetical protein
MSVLHSHASTTVLHVSMRPIRDIRVDNSDTNMHSVLYGTTTTGARHADFSTADSVRYISCSCRRVTRAIRNTSAATAFSRPWHDRRRRITLRFAAFNADSLINRTQTCSDSSGGTTIFGATLHGAVLCNHCCPFRRGAQSAVVGRSRILGAYCRKEYRDGSIARRGGHSSNLRTTAPALDCASRNRAGADTRRGRSFCSRQPQERGPRESSKFNRT